MVREWKEWANHDGGAHQGFSNAAFLLWVVLITLSLMSAIIFSCSDGASKDKTSTQTDGYNGTGCTACGGTACGGWTLFPSPTTTIRNQPLLEIFSCIFSHLRPTITTFTSYLIHENLFFSFFWLSGERMPLPIRFPSCKLVSYFLPIVRSIWLKINTTQ